MPERDRIVIANCGGFWGDDPTAARRQVEGGPIDYLVMDYLAEVTMAILQKQRARRPDLILTDLEMPFLGGLDMIAALQEDATLRDVPPSCLAIRI